MKEEARMLTPVEVALRVAEETSKLQSEVATVLTRHLHDGLMTEVFTLYALVETLLDFQLASGTLNDHQKRRCYRLMKRIKSRRRQLDEQVRTGKRSAFEDALKELRELHPGAAHSLTSEPVEAE